MSDDATSTMAITRNPLDQYLEAQKRKIVTTDAIEVEIRYIFRGNPTAMDLLRMEILFLVEQLPDSGLSELFESLNDMIEFYTTPVKEELLLLPRVTLTPVQWGPTTIRPVPPLDIDED